MRRRPPLRGWKLYAALGGMFYVVLLFLTWMLWTAIHYNRSALDGFSEVATFTAVVTACFLAFFAFDRSRHGE